MSELLDLSNLSNVAEHRDALVADLPEMLEIGEFHYWADKVRRGEHADVVAWFRGKVSVDGHGLNAGKLGLTPEQTLEFNPIARDHELIANTRLWTPDDVDKGLIVASKVGDIVDYQVLPDYDTLPERVFKADEHFVADGLFTGTIGRIDAQLGVAIRSELPEDGVRRLTILTGMRAVNDSEGANGLYKDFLPDDLDKDTPISVVFPSATDAALAILRKRCSQFVRIGQVEDSELTDKPANRTAHPTLGSRTWVTETYDAVYEGVPLLITVVNGEPVVPYGKPMNRREDTPEPVASETFQDYLRVRDSYLGNITIGASFPHVPRIAAKLASVTQESPDKMVETISLVGSMPQPVTWNAVKNGLHGGGTLTIKELYPTIRAFNLLLGLAEDNLRV